MTDKNKDALIAVASMLASAGLQGGSQSNPASPTRGSEDPAELMRMAMKKASTTPGHTTGKSDKSKNPHFQRFLCSIFFSLSCDWRVATSDDRCSRPLSSLRLGQTTGDQSSPLFPHAVGRTARATGGRN